MKKYNFFIYITLGLIFNWAEFSNAQTVSANQAVSYMSYLSSKLVNRPLSSEEVAQIRSQGTQAFPIILEAWSNDARFHQSVRQYVEVLFATNGSSNGINFDLPGNLGLDIARRKRPYSDLVTAQSCVDAQGNITACDSGAPFSAGVLTMRAFLRKAQGAYNISRAGKMMHKFLCTTYPLPDALEPKLRVTDLISEFATVSGPITFGNGNNCYSCHSQFGHHAQFFVKFDLDGNYRANATGLQSVGATAGYSANNLLTSHLVDPLRARDESSQILGQRASNLQEAARVIANSSLFLPCAIQHMMRHFLKLSDQNMASIKPDLFKKISDDAKVLNQNPSFSHLLQSLITNRSVIDSFVKSGALP
jgi:hypothetical protein